MLALSKKNNDLKIYAENEKRKKNESIHVNALHFPILSEDFIRKLAYGVYQLKQAKNYTKEQPSGSYIQYLSSLKRKKSDKNKVKITELVATNIQHFYRVRYYTKYIKSGWYYDCKTGARVVGTSAHVASVLQHFGVAKNEPKLLHKTAASTYEKLFLDASSIKIRL